MIYAIFGIAAVAIIASFIVTMIGNSNVSNKQEAGITTENATSDRVSDSRRQSVEKFVT